VGQPDEIADGAAFLASNDALPDRGKAAGPGRIPPIEA
jgi:hypothetical protein